MSSFACIIFFFSAAVKSAQAAKILDFPDWWGFCLCFLVIIGKAPGSFRPEIVKKRKFSENFARRRLESPPTWCILEIAKNHLF